MKTQTLIAALLFALSGATLAAGKGEHSHEQKHKPLHGSAKSEATLVPLGDDRLEARGRFQVAAGTKIVATINLTGKKPINVRFAIK